MLLLHPLYEIYAFLACFFFKRPVIWWWWSLYSDNRFKVKITRKFLSLQFLLPSPLFFFYLAFFFFFLLFFCLAFKLIGHLRNFSDELKRWSTIHYNSRKSRFPFKHFQICWRMNVKYSLVGLLWFVHTFFYIPITSSGWCVKRRTDAYKST